MVVALKEWKLNLHELFDASLNKQATTVPNIPGINDCRLFNYKDNLFPQTKAMKSKVQM